MLGELLYIRKGYFLPDIIAADTDAFQVDWISVFDRHFHCLQMRVHGDVNAGDRPVDLCSVFKLHRHCLVGQLHQEPEQKNRGLESHV